jgi:hypothetical protein
VTTGIRVKSTSDKVPYSIVSFNPSPSEVNLAFSLPQSKYVCPLCQTPLDTGVYEDGEFREEPFTEVLLRSLLQIHDQMAFLKEKCKLTKR